MLRPVNPLPNNNFLEWSKLKALADDNINVIQKQILFGIGKKHRAFSPFPTVFSKRFFFRVIKNRDCVVKRAKTKQKGKTPQKGCFSLR